MQRRLLLGGAAALAASVALPAHAQKFPAKPVTLVVPFAPGGNLDVVARTLAPALERSLGQPVVVDNRAGAGGALGAAFVARAPADGHTLLVSTPNALVVLPLIAKQGFQLASFSPVGLAATTPLVVVVRGEGRFKDIGALLAEARAKPGQVSAGHAGPGTTNHVALLQLEQVGKLSLNAVPYKGSAPALTDLIGGQIDMVVDQLTSSAAHIRSGSLRALAVMSRERDPALPGIPTLREAGLANFEATTATGLLAPAGTPPDAIRALNDALRKALDDEAVKGRLISVGSPGRASSPQEWLDTLKREDANAQLLAKAGKLKSE
ncbi:tripartite tricarboxylate transporter substrate binding protein [Variovorax paradoxus]|nr:tripartite tricarboxylate transporter substrate binding protein [Variovorax paradoxus]MBT2302821.1 tripartite tricarboxylate transporter substrate binding protein [Variovorax paradoxus]